MTTIQDKTKYLSLAVYIKAGNDLPYDYPFVFGEMWHPVIEITTGQILNFMPQNVEQHLHIKVSDTGVYTLFDRNLKQLHQFSGYVPHDVIPGEYGDYIILDIDKNGLITNWPEAPCVKAIIA